LIPKLEKKKKKKRDRTKLRNLH